MSRLQPGGAFEFVGPLAPNDHDFLERLRSRATAFSLADREQKTLNLPLTLDR